MAQRWATGYEELLDWAARLRGLTVPAELTTAVELLARLVDEPIDAYRQSIADLVEAFDRIPEALANGTALTLEMTLTLTIPPAATDALNAELARLKSEYF